MIELLAALRLVVEAFDRSGARYVIVGSVASSAWGVSRSTRDVDLVAELDPAQLETFLAGIDRSELYVPDADARIAAASGRSFNVIHPASGGKVDIFLPSAVDPFTQSRLSRRVPAVILGLPVWVASAEDVVLAKLRWRLVSRSEIQWRDCAEIAAVIELDREYLDRWAKVIGVVDDLAQLLDEVDRA